MLCPFSMHRMALAGKELEKDVGKWLGPSTAAGTIKCVDVAIFAAYMLTFFFRSLVQSFPDASLGISVASTVRTSRRMCIWHHIRPPDRLVPANYRDGGGRALVILISIELGIDGVSPIFYDTIMV